MEVEHYVSEHLIGLNLDQQLKALIGEIKEKILQGAIGKTAKMRVGTKRNNIKERVQ